MEIRYTWRSEDALNALRAQSVRGWTAFQFVLLLALLFLVGIYLIDHEIEPAGWIWLTASAVFGFVAYEVPRIQVRRAVQQSPSAQVSSAPSGLRSHRLFTQGLRPGL